MKRKIIIEGITFSVIGLIAVIEGFRLSTGKDPQGIFSLMGPGTYTIVLGFGLIITAIASVFLNYRKVSGTGKAALSQEKESPSSKVVVYMIGVFAIYAFLIDIFGYLMPTILFLLLEFRLVGVKSWKTNIVVTSAVVAVFYLVFIQYCGMIFPRGIFLN